MRGNTDQLISSNLDSCAYDPETSELDVTFKSGGTWTYRNVNQQEYEGLLTAPSAGKYFHNIIRGKPSSRA